MKKRELKDVYYIYSTIILFGWLITSNIQFNKQTERFNQELLQAKELVVAIDKDYDVALDNLASMNSYADQLEAELQTYKYLEHFKKELDRHTSK